MSGSTRITFRLTLPDGRSCEGLGRLVETLPSRRAGRSGYGTDATPSPGHRPWLIHVLEGPEIYDEIAHQTSPLDVVLSDGRAGKVVISDEATLRGSGELTKGSTTGDL